MRNYSKFWVSLIGAIVTVLGNVIADNKLTLDDIYLLGPVITAGLVLWIPNTSSYKYRLPPQ